MPTVRPFAAALAVAALVIAAGCSKKEPSASSAPSASASGASTARASSSAPPVNLLSAPVTAVAVRGTEVFAMLRVDDREQRLVRCSVDDCASPSEVARLDGFSHAIYAQDDGVYVVATVGVEWIAGSPDATHATSRVLRVRQGGEVRTLSQTPLSEAEVMRLAFDGASVYVAVDGPRRKIGRMARSGGAIEPLAEVPDQHPFGIAVDDGDVYWTAGVRGGGGGGVVCRVRKAGGPPTEIVRSSDMTRGIVLEGDTVYWSTMPSPAATRPTSGDVFATPKRGGTTRKLFGGRKLATPLAVADGRIYAFAIAPDDTWRLLAVGLDGGNPDTVDTGHFTPSGLAAGSTAIVWATVDYDGTEGGALRKRPR
jgi:hypothetical protein